MWQGYPFSVAEIRSRREEYSQATRQALIDAATTTFVERGYARSSLDDIASAARVTKGALYHHFDGKQALLEEAMDQAEQAVHARILAEVAEHPDDPWRGALEALNVFLDACCEPVYGHPCFVEGPVALGWSRWREFEEKYAYRLIESLVRGLLAVGLVQDVPVQAATHVGVGMLSHAGMVLAEAPPDQRPQLRAEVASVLRRLFNGLRLPKQQ
jgi:AcrR family transcriptional regulator